jgi:hypothetical protein
MTNLEFEIVPRPLEVPAALLALPADAVVNVKSNMCGVEYQGQAVAAELRKELKSVIDRQGAGFFTINETAQILADVTGDTPQRQRKKIWASIEKGTLKALDECDRAPILEFSKSAKFASILCVKEICAAMPSFPNAATPAPVVAADGPEPQTAQATTGNTPRVERHTTKGKRRDTLTPVIEYAQSLCKDLWDVAEVWGQLHTLTAQKYAVLLHLDGAAVAYMDGEITKKLTKKNLGDRLREARKKLV